MFDVVALGELLIDFAPLGARDYQANPGGAPANVLASLIRLGGSGAFIGMVGDDGFGRMLEKDIRDAGIDTSGLRFTDRASTTLAFVQLDEHGDRSFTFVRKPGADMLLEESDVDFGLIDSGKIFHYGSVSMSSGPARATTLAAARYAHEKGILCSYDPNLRPPLWENLQEAGKVIAEGVRYCDILKISEEELTFLTGESDLFRGSAALMERGVKLVLVTLGPMGCYYRYAGGSGRLPTFDVRVVDTTGAGDAFLGGVLSQLAGRRADELPGLSREEVERIVELGNAVGSLATTKKGAIPAMPTRQEALDCIRTVPRVSERP